MDVTDVPSFVYPVTKATVFLEMLVNLYQIIWHHIPEDSNFHDEFSENIKSLIYKEQPVHPALVVCPEYVTEKA